MIFLYVDHRRFFHFSLFCFLVLFLPARACWALCSLHIAWHGAKKDELERCRRCDGRQSRVAISGFSFHNFLLSLWTTLEMDHATKAPPPCGKLCLSSVPTGDTSLGGGATAATLEGEGPPTQDFKTSTIFLSSVAWQHTTGDTTAAHEITALNHSRMPNLQFICGTTPCPVPNMVAKCGHLMPVTWSPNVPDLGTERV